jgi:hypothetical protein
VIPGPHAIQSFLRRKAAREPIKQLVYFSHTYRIIVGIHWRVGIGEHTFREMIIKDFESKIFFDSIEMIEYFFVIFLVTDEFFLANF